MDNCDCDCDWDARKMLDMYIHDYMVRKNMHESAETFAAEANVCPKSVSINPPEGFLTEWWSIFWDVYSARQQNHDAVGGSTSMAPEIADRTLPNPNPIELPNMLPNVFPTLSPRPELNPNMLGSNPFLDSIGGGQSRATSHILNIEQIARLLPSSSRPNIPQKNVGNKVPIPLAIDKKDNPRGGIVREKTPLQPKAVQIKTEPASYGSSTSSNSKGSKSGSASDESK